MARLIQCDVCRNTATYSGNYSVIKFYNADDEEGMYSAKWEVCNNCYTKLINYMKGKPNA